MVLTKIAIATLVIGLVIGGALGYMIGFGRAFRGEIWTSLFPLALLGS